MAASTRTETVPASLAGERLDRAVSLLTGLPRSDAAELVAAGGVRVGGQAATGRSRRLQEGETLEIDVPDAAGPTALTGDDEVDVPVVYADADVIVIDKPVGLVVHPGSGNESGTMVQGLLARFPDLAGVGDPERPGIVHRLDKGTSGLMVVARTPAAYQSLVAQLATRTATRVYLALVAGRVEADAGLIDAPLGRGDRDPTRMAVAQGGREARTRYEVVRRFATPEAVTLVRCRLETGRTHQIRVHLAAIGHPVIGDDRYRGQQTAVALDRPFLHAGELAFDHPATGERTSFTSPLPFDLEQVLAGLA
jgi:23S rRNA pseudouridine1911/1915/1917 synthase